MFFISFIEGWVFIGIIGGTPDKRIYECLFWLFFYSRNSGIPGCCIWHTTASITNSSNISRNSGIPMMPHMTHENKSQHTLPTFPGIPEFPGVAYIIRTSFSQGAAYDTRRSSIKHSSHISRNSGIPRGRIWHTVSTITYVTNIPRGPGKSESVNYNIRYQ